MLAVLFVMLTCLLDSSATGISSTDIPCEGVEVVATGLRDPELLLQEDGTGLLVDRGNRDFAVAPIIDTTQTPPVCTGQILYQPNSCTRFVLQSAMDNWTLTRPLFSQTTWPS